MVATYRLAFTFKPKDLNTSIIIFMLLLHNFYDGWVDGLARTYL